MINYIRRLQGNSSLLVRPQNIIWSTKLVDGKQTDVVEFYNQRTRVKIYINPFKSHIRTISDLLSANIKELLVNYEPQAINLEAAYDDFRQNRNGYSFLYDSRNTAIHTERQKYLQYLAKAEELDAKKWKRRFDETISLCWYLIHFTSGQPARSTEAGKLLLVNNGKSQV